MPKKFLGKYILSHLYSNEKKITEEKIQRYSDYFRKKDNINAIIQTAKNIIPDNVDELESKMSSIQTPALIVWGTKDFVVPGRNVERLDKELQNSKLVKIKDSGHMIQEEQPEATYTAINEFLENQCK